jgi:predicted transcriptional regulator
MILTAIAQHADEANGISRLTYDHLETAANLSRAKVSEGLKVLENRELISRLTARRSMYQLCNYGPPEEGGWAKFPANRMYNRAGEIVPFQTFRLRSRAELDALKLFFLFVGRRGSDTNAANISYDKIEQYTGIERSRIRTGISLLIENLMIQVEQQPSSSNEHGVSHAYRIAGIEPLQHQGTTGRRGL